MPGGRWHLKEPHNGLLLLRFLPVDSYRGRHELDGNADGAAGDTR
jgi:hypothetical protein